MRIFKHALWLTTFCFLSISYAQAQQNSYLMKDSIDNYLAKQMRENMKKFKDSSAVYSFAIKINLSRINKHSVKIDSISTNNPIISNLLFGDLAGLKKLDYNNYTKNYKKVKIIKPVLIHVGHWEPTNKSFNIHEFYFQSLKLFYINNPKFQKDDFYKSIFFTPYCMIFDLSGYD